MSGYELKPELDLAMSLAKEAGEEILRIYETDFKVEYKDDKSPLTEADKKSNQIIVSAISKNFPEHAVLSEEYDDDKSRLNNEWCWIIDPLDGTKEFLKKNGEFTVNIALAHKGRVVLGIVYIPVKDEMFYAVKGQGAFLEKHGVSKKITVSDRTSNLVLVKSRSHASEKLQKLIDDNKGKIAKDVSSGSSIKGCLIANGTADIYYRFGLTMEWDTAAVQCVVEEADGIFRQMDDSEMTYNRENSLNEKGFYILNKIENKFSID